MTDFYTPPSGASIFFSAPVARLFNLQGSNFPSILAFRAGLRAPAGAIAEARPVEQSETFHCGHTRRRPGMPLEGVAL